MQPSEPVIISQVERNMETLYFAVNPSDRENPFIFGGKMMGFASASTFGLYSLEDIDGALWEDWRQSLRDLQCPWVIPILEKALETGDQIGAMAEILKKSPAL